MSDLTRVTLYLLFLVATFKSGFSQVTKPEFLRQPSHWADSVLKTLTPRERLAQLIMVAAYSNKDKNHTDYIVKLIKDEKIGGIIMMQGGPIRHAKTVNLFQKASKIPLLISMDAEWGPAMRLDSVPVFPKQMTLGSLVNDSLVFRMGVEIARQCSLLGVHVNFAPVADVNNNPANPVINMRAFGDDKWNVYRKSLAYARGLEFGKVMANAKHFPGHGDTDSDSHKTLPTIKHSRERLDSLELFPFKKLIESGLSSMMIAHLFVPALHPADQLTTSVSENVIQNLLRKQLGFEGLIFTDALNMKGISERDTPEQINLKALLAGNDILLFPDKISSTLDLIEKAIKENKITQQEIDNRCKKVLMAKYWTGAYKFKSLDTQNLHKELNHASAYELIRELNRKSITLCRNNSNTLPVSSKNVAILSLGASDDAFLQGFDKSTLVIRASKEEAATKQKVWLNQLKNASTVIVAVHNAGNKMSKSAGLTDEIYGLLKTIKAQRIRTVLVHFANPYALQKISSADIPDAIVQVYEDTKFSREEASKVVRGEVKPEGRLSVKVNSLLLSGSGSSYSDLTPFSQPDFTPPLIKSNLFRSIDAIALEGINNKAYPGCQVLIAKNGDVVYEKAFGYHTYDKSTTVKTSDLYDIASITKVASTTISIMKLVDLGYLDIDKALGDYIPQLAGTNKAGLRLRDVLAHQAGLPAWIPFYKSTIANESTRNRYYKSASNDTFNLAVAENLWMRNDYKDSILYQIALCPINTKQGYKYSDLGYYFFQYIIEQYAKMPLNRFVDSVFYKPMGLSRISYLPLEKYSLNEICPTEKDDVFRKQLIDGYVHDQGAAMMGGVAGHAGLFSNARDLSAIMQMILNKGVYNGNRYISQATIEEFTRCQFCANDNRRGLGFDKPEMNYKKTGPTCKCVSSLSFGHTGFTGTIAWADPDQQIIYIFLSNRVYPDAENKKLNESNIRVRIQEEIYRIAPQLNKLTAESN